MNLEIVRLQMRITEKGLEYIAKCPFCGLENCIPVNDYPLLKDSLRCKHFHHVNPEKALVVFVQTTGPKPFLVWYPGI